MTYLVFGHNDIGGNGTMELSDLNGTNGFMMNGVETYDWSGSFLSGAGDVNGDGLSDVFIEAQYASPSGRAQAGASYVVFGSSTLGERDTLELSSLNGENGFAISDGVAGDNIWWSVSGISDVNGDGLSDVLIGAYWVSPGGRTYAGSSYVVFGEKLPTVINNLHISQGGTTILTSAELALNQSNDSQPVWWVCQVQHGQFGRPQFYPPGQGITSWTNEQVHDEQIIFVSDGGFQCPNFSQSSLTKHYKTRACVLSTIRRRAISSE